MKTRFLYLFPVLFACLSASAGEAAPDRREALRQEVLDRVKEAESYSHRERIRILQEADACLHSAKSREAFRACEGREQQARDRLREELRGRREALREALRQRLQPRGRDS